MTWSGVHLTGECGKEKRKEGDEFLNEIQLPLLFFLNTEKTNNSKAWTKDGVPPPKDISVAEMFRAWNYKAEMLPCQRF